MPSSKTSWPQSLAADRRLRVISIRQTCWRAPSRASSGVATPKLRIDEMSLPSLQPVAGICWRPQVCGQRAPGLSSRAIVALVRRLACREGRRSFKFRLVKRSFDARLQLIGQLALLAMEARLVSRRLARSRSKPAILSIERICTSSRLPGGLLAIARDKRHGSAAVEAVDDGNQSAKWDIQRLRNVKKDIQGEIFECLS